MAIDTQAKRASVLDIVQPDGTIGQADRQTVLGIYGGILVSPAPTPTPVTTTKTIIQILAAIDTLISTIVSSPDDIADYRIGEKTVSKSQILTLLVEAREEYLLSVESEPWESVQHIALDVDIFGKDLSEYIGDVF